jgi:hypothetical protein
MMKPPSAALAQLIANWCRSVATRTETKDQYNSICFEIEPMNYRLLEITEEFDRYRWPEYEGSDDLYWFSGVMPKGQGWLGLLLSLNAHLSSEPRGARDHAYWVKKVGPRYNEDVIVAETQRRWVEDDIREFCGQLAALWDNDPTTFATILEFASDAFRLGRNSLVAARVLQTRAYVSGSNSKDASDLAARALRAQRQEVHAPIRDAVSTMHTAFPKRSWTDVCGRVAKEHGVSERTVRRATVAIRWGGARKKGKTIR